MTIFIWLLIMIAFLVIEAVTVGLTTIWFAVGALAGLIVCALGLGTFGQFVVFFVVSFILLIFTRPIALKYISTDKIRTNYEDTVDKVVRITQRVDNLNGTGAGMLNGQEWTVRSMEEQRTFEVGEFVKVSEVSGVKLMVVPLEKE